VSLPLPAAGELWRSASTSSWFHHTLYVTRES
jgi:hypothetical protein